MHEYLRVRRGDLSKNFDYFFDIDARIFLIKIIFPIL